ncbi:hypothetical protein BDI4_1080078 [Burkholderia diffusa]|nr:hypothetical protein BDI4_1080078 [Burkholderia diffusa]
MHACDVIRENRGELPVAHNLDDCTDRVHFDCNKRSNRVARKMIIDEPACRECVVQQDQRLLAKVTHWDCLAARGTRVAAAYHKAQRFLKEGLAIYVGRKGRMERHAEIELVVYKLRFHLILSEFANIDPDARMQLSEAIDDRPDQVCRIGRGYRETQAAPA